MATNSDPVRGREASPGGAGQPFELSDLPLDEYVARRDELTGTIVAAEASPIRSSRSYGSTTTSRPIVDDWPAMTAGQRRPVLVDVFDQIVVDGQEVVGTTPKAGLASYIADVVRPELVALPREGLVGRHPAFGTTRFVLRGGMLYAA